MHAAPEASILLCEDDPDDIEFAKAALKRAGIDNQVVAVWNGEEAIEFLEWAEQSRRVPSIVFVDLKMPLVGGFDLLRWALNRPVLKAVRFVVMSASGREEDKLEAYSLGAFDYIVKYPNPLQIGRVFNRAR
jgi:CheY-like chemotaxis protein